jgi:hypothetical protein
MKNGEAKEEVIPPGKLPRGVALMIRNILGIDPQELGKQIDQTFRDMTGFLHHADRRMSHVIEELRALKAEVAALRAERQQQPEKPEDDRSDTDSASSGQ